MIFVMTFLQETQNLIKTNAS